jgi:hypothetical protein
MRALDSSDLIPSPDAAIERMIAETFVQSWDQHIGMDGAIAVLNALDAAGLKVVRKDETERMLGRVRNLGAP